MDNKANNSLRDRYRIIFRYIGSIIAFEGILFFIPTLITLFYPSEMVLIGPFLLVSAILGIGGILVYRLARINDEPSLSVQEGMVVVIIVWLTAILAGTLPFMFINKLNFTQAIFESTSGWTTCGLTMLEEDAQPRIILFYRSLIQLVGGIGFIIITFSSISAVPADENLSSAAGRSRHITNHIRKSTIILLSLYLGYVLIGLIGFRIAGMSWFDAINHAFTGAATGGFSTRSDSLGFWDDIAIESVAIMLMILGALNFSSVFVLIQGKFRTFFYASEVRITMFLLPLSILIIFTGVTLGIYPTLEESVRVAIFETTSALTGTGFATTEYSNWNSAGWLLLTILIIIGGGSGSTTGGVKQNRIYALYKIVIWEFKRLLYNKDKIQAPTIYIGTDSADVDDKLVRQITIFLFIFFVTFIGGSLIFVASGYGLKESLFEFASTLATVGLSSGITGADAPLHILWTQIAGMFLGRLEFFAVIVGGIKLTLDMRYLFSAKHTEQVTTSQKA